MNNTNEINATYFLSLEAVKGVGKALIKNINVALTERKLVAVKDLANIKGVGPKMYTKMVSFLRETAPENVLTINAPDKASKKVKTRGTQVKRVKDAHTTQFDTPPKMLSRYYRDDALISIAMKLKSYYDGLLSGVVTISMVRKYVETLKDDLNTRHMLTDVKNVIASEVKDVIPLMKVIARVLELGVTPISIRGQIYDHTFEGSLKRFQGLNLNKVTNHIVDSGNVYYTTN